MVQGLINLVGLTIAAPRPRGGFSYTHPPTGFVFEIVNDDSDSEDEAGSLVFNPLSFGSAEEVLDHSSIAISKHHCLMTRCNQLHCQADKIGHARGKYLAQSIHSRI